MPQKIDFHFSEETIERIAERAAERIEEQLDTYIKEGISFRLLDEDSISAITDAIRNIDSPDMKKIEICVHQARGHLFTNVKHKTLEKVLQIITAELKILNEVMEDRRKEKANAEV